MDSGKLPGAKNGSNRITPPSGAYWAARLIERKRAEKTLEDRYGQLRERVEEQETQLSALNEALRRAGARPRARWLVGRGPKGDAPGGVAPHGGEELPVELLRVDVSNVQQRLEQQTGELQALRADLGVERERREQAERAYAATAAAHAASTQRIEELSEALGRQAKELGALRTLADAPRDAGRRAHVPGDARMEDREQHRRALEQHAARVQVLSEEIKRESGARTQADVALQQQQAEVQRRVADHSAVLRTVSGAMDRELATRREDQAEHAERQKRGQREAVDLAKQLRVVSAELEQEISDRKGAATHLERAHAALEQQGAEQGAALQALERNSVDRRAEIDRKLVDAAESERGLRELVEHEVSDRKGGDASLERATAKVDQRIVAQMATVEMLVRESSDGKTAQEALQEQLEGRVTECTRALEAVTMRVTQATAERQRLQESVADLEAWRSEGGGRLVSDTRAREVEDAACRDVAIRPAGTLTILDEAREAGEPAPGREDILVAMNGIIGLTELGLDTELTPAQREYLERVKCLATEALTPGVSPEDEDVAADDREPEAFRLREHLRDTLKPLLVRGRQKGLKFSCQIAPRVPDQVFGHPGHLRQVIINLVGNAIKFTEHGEITVCVDTASQSASVAALMVSVVDTGGGIALDRQGVVFDALMPTLPGSSTGGLGLPISAELVRLMEGRLWFESDEEQGSKFRFTTRLGLQEAPRRSWWRLGGKSLGRKGKTRAPRDGRVVLIADANPGDRGVLKDILEGEGITGVTVADGRGVLAALEHDAFDLILMDLRMPGMDAFEAAATIRALEGAGVAGVPMVAIGAQVSALDERRCEVVGIERCLTRPVQARRLLAIIDELLQAPGAASSVDLEVDD